MYTKLTGSAIKKRPSRADTILEKIDKKEDFYLVNGSKIKIDKKKSSEFILGVHEFKRTNDTRRMSSAVFVTTTGQKKKISDLGKSGEFGGKGQGAGTAAEDRALSDLRNKLMVILEASKKSSIKVVVGKEVVEVADVVTTPGTPKSDFHFVDAQGNEVAWISHKDGTTAKAYQQYGGLTELDKLFPNHAEIQKFIEDAKALSGGAFKPSESYMRELKSNDINRAAVYGIDFRKRTGRQHVNILCQGEMNLNKQGQRYVLKSSHDMVDGELPTADYRSTLFVRKGDRSNFGIANARFMIAPYALRRGTTIDI